ncbi:MAG: response regulator [Desulfobacteraceae bacterium]|nr:response regulator [Desulfobacteraceae bacterium]
MKLQTKIFLLLVPLIVIPLVILGWSANNRLISNARNAINNQMDTAVSLVANQIQTRIRSVESNAVLYTQSIQLANFLLTANQDQKYSLMIAPLLKLFASYQKTFPDYVEIRVLAPDGFEDVRLANISVKNASYDESKSPFFKKISVSQNPAHTFFIKNPDTGQYNMLVTRKILLVDITSNAATSEPVLKGFFVLTIAMDDFQKQVSSHLFGENGCMFFTNRKGEILFHSDESKNRSVLAAPIFSQFVKSCDASIRKIFFIKDESGEVIAKGKQIHPDLFVFATLPKKELSKAATHWSLIVSGATFATLVFIFGAVFVIIFFVILKPLQKVNTALEKLGKGDMQAMIPEANQDEIGTLSREFNTMMEKLQNVSISRDYMDAVLDSMNDTVFAVSPAGLIKKTNMGGIELTGFTQKELMEKSIMDFFKEYENTLFSQFLAQPHLINEEQTVITKDLEQVAVLVSLSTMTPQSPGSDTDVICVIRDIRELKKNEQEKADLEAKLFRLQKMEALGTLAGGVAHDLNNILSGISAYPELLLEDLPQDSPLRKPITIIKKSGTKAAAVVQDLLTLARRGVATMEIVNINDLVKNSIESPECESIMEYHPDVAVNIDLDTDLLNVKGSELHIGKTIMNLISNSAEAMPKGGNIFIKTRNRYIDMPLFKYDQITVGDYIVITVTDMGDGIAPEDVDHIFEPFYTKKKMGRSGSGLGMAVVWGTVKDHKGYIDVKSEPGKGTSFDLYFPATREAVPKEESDISLEDLKGNNERILVVDDVEEQRFVAVSILKRLGYQPESVESGEAAIAYLIEKKVDLIVLDMIMEPGLDGLETYEKILKTNPNQKAIIASGFAETERVRKVQHLGAAQYIKKPYTPLQIGKAVKKVLDNYHS